MLKLLTTAVLACGLFSNIAQSAEAESNLLKFDSYISMQKSTAKLKLMAVKGDSLRETLSGWSDKAGWQPLIWNLPPTVDFTLEASATFDGDFPTIITSFVEALGADAKFKVIINPSNNVISIESDEQL